MPMVTVTTATGVAWSGCAIRRSPTDGDDAGRYQVAYDRRRRRRRPGRRPRPARPSAETTRHGRRAARCRDADHRLATGCATSSATAALAARRRHAGVRRRRLRNADTGDRCRRASNALNLSFTVTGATATSPTRATAASIDINVINNRDWIDVMFTSRRPAGCSTSPRSATWPRSSCSAAPAWAPSSWTATRAPTCVDRDRAPSCTYRYWLTGPVGHRRPAPVTADLPRRTPGPSRHAGADPGVTLRPSRRPPRACRRHLHARRSAPTPASGRHLDPRRQHAPTSARSSSTRAPTRATWPASSSTRTTDWVVTLDLTRPITHRQHRHLGSSRSRSPAPDRVEHRVPTGRWPREITGGTLSYVRPGPGRSRRRRPRRRRHLRARPDASRSPPPATRTYIDVDFTPLDRARARPASTATSSPSAARRATGGHASTSVIALGNGNYRYLLTAAFRPGAVTVTFDLDLLRRLAGARAAHPPAGPTTQGFTVAGATARRRPHRPRDADGSRAVVGLGGGTVGRDWINGPTRYLEVRFRATSGYAIDADQHQRRRAPAARRGGSLIALGAPVRVGTTRHLALLLHRHSSPPAPTR